jgi:hypothetical protein
VADNIVTKQVGPLPMWAWVGIASGGVLVIILMTKSGGASTSANNQTNSVNSLAPTEAEAFGTIEQQQQDVTNALTTLGQNQSALGGSLSTLTGIVTQQGTDNAASFQSLLDGQNTIEQEITSGQTQDANYFQTLGTNITNYFNSLGSQVSGLNSSVTGLGTQVSQIQNQQQADALAQNYGFANLDSLLAYMFYQIPNRYSPYFPASVNPSQNVASSVAAPTS